MDDSAENKILIAANETFLLLGFHGTTIAEIARTAGVNKTAIHYYFRSKERIYSIVLRKNLTLLLNAMNKSNEPLTPDVTQNIEAEMIAWFLISEIRTNSQLIRKMIRTDDMMCNLITSIYSYPENLEILESLITSQFSKIIDQDLKTFCLKGTNKI
ncbi:MAG: TetR/AcrR family transcriptional regulator [Prolixibacteraceae bacterium]|nr:TetR/AcrR family transcriptional regulator [Prolixibacteraceae bacterium]